MTDTKRKGFLWLNEWADLTVDFTDAQLGKLLRAVQSYSMGNDVKLGKDKEVRLAFNFIAGCVNRYNEKYDTICQKRAEAGKRSKEKQNEQMSANANKCQQLPTIESNCQQMPANADNPNPNPNPNPTPIKGVSDTHARVGVEYFGLFHNVELLPVEYRTLVEQYGEQAVKDTIDDLSCKLGDGSTQSDRHYYTLTHWLRFRKADTTPKEKTREDELRDLWATLTPQEQQKHLKESGGVYPWQDPKYLNK